MNDPLFHLDRVSKDFRDVQALDGVTLDIGGGITGLLGPNGAGKTTLIKVMLGLLKASGGSGRFLDFELGREARSIRGRIGYMPEDDCYIDGLSGVEMVAFGGRLSGLPALESLRRAHEILDFSGIEQERYRQVGTYSTGMRQKLKFAQAIVHDPPVLILDEPTTGLDPEERRAMLQRIRILARNAGKAALISTHILPDVQEICETVIILVRGRVRLVEAMEVLARPSSPAYRLRALGDPEALLERMRREGYEPAVGEDGTISVTAADDSFVRGVWAWARDSEVAVRSLAPARNSLEEIFLDAVRERQ